MIKYIGVVAIALGTALGVSQSSPLHSLLGDTVASKAQARSRFLAHLTGVPFENFIKRAATKLLAIILANDSVNV